MSKDNSWRLDLEEYRNIFGVITKREWVLKGETVYYASHESIKETLDYDFRQEKEFSYERLSPAESIKHIAKFTAGIWQIHPFCEGNTRSTAVFIIKYLKTFGFTVRNMFLQLQSI